MDCYISVGLWFMNSRVKKGVTVDELSKRLGITQTHIYGIEKGLRWPSGLLVRKFCDVMEVDFPLLAEEQPETKKKASPKKQPSKKPENLRDWFSDELFKKWLKLYDQDFIDREILKAEAWLMTHKHRSPKSKRGFSQFMGSWLNRSWDDKGRLNSRNAGKSNTNNGVRDVKLV